MATSAFPAIASAADFENPKAEKLYDVGVQKFDAGDYAAALDDLERSIALERNASSLYAYAQTLNKLERCREAVPVYNEVLDKLPEESGARPAVKDALVKCAEKLAEEDVAPTPAPILESDGDEGPTELDEPVDEPEPEKPAKRWYTDPYAPVLIGVGAVGVGVGGWYLSEASKENAKRPELYDEFAAKGDRVRELQIRGGVILGIGGALVLTGAIRYAVLGARGRRAATAFSPVIGPRWTGVSVSGRF